MKINGFPAQILYFVQTLVAFFVAFGLNLDEGQVGAITTITAALLTGYAAFVTRPMTISVIAASATTIGTAVAAFGFDMSPEQLGMSVALGTIVLGYLTHQSVSPIGGELDKPVGVRANSHR